MNFYETDDAVAQYLLFHYGRPEQISPLLPETRAACGFPARCVSETLPHLNLPQRNRALDLGCAVGRSSLELARTFREVVGIDFSERFITAAQQMVLDRRRTILAPQEGARQEEIFLELPTDLTGKGVRFQQGDACALSPELGTFDLVLMANLIDRLPEPRRCLENIALFLNPGGGLIITSPYTWLTEYTPREAWLQNQEGTFSALQEILTPLFSLRARLNLPFLIREHVRKFQWSIAEASVWELKPR